MCDAEQKQKHFEDEIMIFPRECGLRCVSCFLFGHFPSALFEWVDLGLSQSIRVLLGGGGYSFTQNSLPKQSQNYQSNKCVN